MNQEAGDFYARPFSLDELLAHALTIELEAAQSYTGLAAQMRRSGNDQVAELFEKMSALEAQHAEHIQDEARDIELPELAPWEFRWLEPEPPENIDLAGVHYLMLPYHALTLALENEINAMAFFEAAANNCSNERGRRLAIEFADEERQHVTWMQDWLGKYDEPDADWDYDPDPPAAID